MDFVHCNKCFAIPDRNTVIIFYLSSCGHIACQNCGGPSDGFCRICNKKCTFVELNAQIKPELRQLFSDLSSVSKDLQLKVKSLAQAVDFQKSHRSRYLNFLRQQLKAARHLQETANTEMQKRQQCESEIGALKREIAQLREQLTLRFRSPRSTPVPGHRRHVSNVLDPGITPRSDFSIDSRCSMPAGVSASTFNSSPQHNFVQGNIFSPAPSPDERLARFGEPNLTLDGFRKPAVPRPAEITFKDVWGSNLSEITLESGIRTPIRHSSHEAIVGGQKNLRKREIAKSLGRRR